MAVMAIYRSAEVDRAKYDAVVKEFDSINNPEPGALVHLAAFDEAGLCVVEAWESQEQLQTFAESRLYPLLIRMGVTPTPPQILELHGAMASEAFDRYNQLALAPA